MISGSCQCGGVRYVVDGTFSSVTNCHCSMCQKIHGAAFGTYGGVGRDEFRWTSGEENLRVYESSRGVDRLFCTVCGSTLLFRSDQEPDKCYVTLGTVDSEHACKPRSHIFVGSKAHWHDINDSLPQHDTEPA